MDQELYNFLFDKGNKAQELFVRFMENNLHHKFLAGDRNGKTINKDLIEEICNCSYVEPNNYHGPRLLFSNGEKQGYTMPDELFLLNVGDYGYRFFDVKNRSKEKLYETYNKIYDYAMISKFSKIKTFITIVIWNSNGKGYDIYVKNILDILKDNLGLKPKDEVYFDLSNFKKINKIAINPN